MKIVIKIGSQAILSNNGEIAINLLDDIIHQISTLKQQGHKIILVSSGAVALGRKMVTLDNSDDQVANKQLLASIGQPKLMSIYGELCKKYDLVASQLLLTKYDFQSKHSYRNILRLLEYTLNQNNVLSIVNENDSVAIDELMFTDNDELSGIIAAQIGADKLMLLTSVDGVYTGNPEESGSELIKKISVRDKLPKVSSAKTLVGRGGMLSKLSTARKMAAVGVMTHIANATTPNIITKLIANDDTIGSTVVPDNKKSPLKRYLAFGTNKTQNHIIINDNLFNIIATTNKPISILPVGITALDGQFEKGDVVDVLTQNNIKIGVGVAKYSSIKLQEHLGQKNKPVFLHYNYLYFDYATINQYI